ncbi:cation:proton antiporter [Longimicrobium sp.]|uniref:cation:proton antiporter domain-containing protein n=1 Tax=Longimicrobium sp. TaxID=2029185 RepID=UPI003B3B1446
MTAISTLLAQVLVVLLAARMLGAAFRRIHQPQVVDEMVAGILLGPSLLGWAAPGVSAFLFPPDALGPLNALSQVGLLLFMFLLGLHLDLGTLRGRAPAAMLISLASMVVPFGLGVLLGMYLHADLAPPGIPLTGFALFMGAAMSVTAFPVLARMVAERGLLHTRLGTIALACAALDDVIAWCILAAVVALVRAGAGPLPPWAMLAGAIVFVAAMVLVVRPLLARLAVRFSESANRQRDALGMVLLVVLAAAWTTEALGLHALFGAFLAGVVMPRDRTVAQAVAGRLEDATVVLLLPLFFAFTGLRTHVALVRDPGLAGVLALVIVMAVAGKFGASALAARVAGMEWRESAAIGVLMNTRGLMELVILNVGLEIGVISPTLFAIMVVMALVSTVMTTPLLEWIYPARLVHAETPADPATDRWPTPTVENAR